MLSMADTIRNISGNVNMIRIAQCDTKRIMQSPAERLRFARGYAGHPTSAAAARRFGWSPVTLRAHERGQNDLRPEVAEEYARAFGVSPAWLLYGRGDMALGAVPTIAIAGKVGAGARVPLFDAYEKGDGPQVECPPQLSPHGIVAVEIEGDSMEPVYAAGDLLFYSRDVIGVPDDAIGAKCICEDVDGNAWVKQVRRGAEPGLFNLVSINPAAENQHGVRLKWAARVRLHLPADLAKRVG